MIIGQATVIKDGRPQIELIRAHTRTEAEQQANAFGAFRVNWCGEVWRKIGADWVVIA